MEQTILSKGKNVKEAIQQGLDLLGTKRENVSIEIIQQSSKGFLRLLSKDAVVKLTKVEQKKKESEPHIYRENEASIMRKDLNQTSLEDIIESLDRSDIHSYVHSARRQLKKKQNNSFEETLDGKVWVENSRIFCKPSKLHFPTITIGKGVNLLKNNVPVEGTIVATAEDQFEIQTVEEVQETKWNIHMDSTKLNVYLHVEPGMPKMYRVKDTEPDFHLSLEAEEDIEIINELEYKKILEKLEELYVVQGFNHSEIMRAVNTDTAGKFTVATGTRPQEGENGKIEIMVDTKQKVGEGKSDGTIDYREVKIIPTVQKGQVIAIVDPPVPGKPGFTVSNEPLPAKKTFPIIVQAGKGIELVENGKKIVATEMGRPVIEQKGLSVKVSIIEKLIHRGDVNISSGNIRFKGDLDIFGNVEEGMVVEAPGKIAIFENVYAASVASNTAISIKGNSIRSTISAGNQDIFTSGMVSLLVNIHEQMQKLLLTIQQFINMPAFKMSDYHQKGLLPLIKILLDKKFKVLSTTIRQFIDLSNKGSQLLNKEWLEVAEQLRLCFLSLVPNEYHTFEGMNFLLRRMEELREKYGIDNDRNCSDKLNYTQGSKIFSGGDVLIKGQGCYHSKIHAGGKVCINGVFRGGEVFARQGATVKESGSEAGVISKISVPSDKQIKIGLVKEGTVIQIGKAKHIFQKEQKSIIARLDENGRIIF